jgi:nicotinate-nucleotide adenylyltransferase
MNGHGEVIIIRKAMNTGLLGGTFDPVHNGHIAIAEAVRLEVRLDEVIFMPAAQTPLKEERNISASEHRIEMVKLAIEGIPYFKLSMIEMERGGPSYTVDTIAELRKIIGEENEIFFIVGCDSLASFPEWKEPGRLIQVCRLVAVPRPGYDIPDLVALEKEVPGISENVIILDGPHIDVSATEIREKVAKGLPISHLVPGLVAEYIGKHRLYQGS